MRIRKPYRVCLLIVAFIAIVHTACKKYDASVAESNPDNEWLSGGLQTVYDQSNAAFSHAFPSLPEHLERVHEIGDKQFEATFVSPDNVNKTNLGRGPLYNNVSCSSCHIADGRGKTPVFGDTTVLMLFRISISGENSHGGPNPVPGFGDQLQNLSNLGAVKEADVTIAYNEQSFTFDDGTPYKLRFPTYSINNTYTAFPGDAMLSPRVAAPVFGLGLLEAVSEAEILSRADESDSNADGISGKANYVWNVVTNSTTLGRFGWKANQPSLLQQVAAAYNGDIGVTTSIFPKENSDGQPQYDNRDDDYELSDSLMHSVEFYVRTLAVPVRRNANDAQVKNGKLLFINAGCASCHIPDMRTAVNVSFPSVSNQLIHPYTDLLLHDMGDDLADNRPDFKASGKEWRTQPLWGIGLTQKVNGHNNFLHDGRARNLMEAIMWHGGEANAARNKVKAMNAADRGALIKFLESL